MSKLNEYFPQTVSHPGATLKEKLQELGMSQKEFALRVGKPEQTIVKVINGESSITPDMAVLFEDVLKIPANFWLNRQRGYDESIARHKHQKVLREAEEWARSFPYADMAKFKWVPSTRRIGEKVKALFQFFSVSNHIAWENYYYGQKLKLDFRISLAHTSQPFAIAAWLRQGELQAALIETMPFNDKTFKAKLEIIKGLMASHPANFFSILQAHCLEAGVKVVYTPCLKGAPIHGSTRWINDTPLIQLSARFKRNDIFWFTFFHEAGHILKHGKKYISIENIKDYQFDEKKENDADQFAIDWTFSEEEESEVRSAFPLSEEDILAFAQKFGTHPAMIIGRFQRKKDLHYSHGLSFIKPICLSLD